MIRFENVTKRYRGTARPALDDIDFEVERGEFVFLVGASGSGKSSCLRLMMREDTPTDGRVLVLGRDTRTLSDRRTPYFRRNIGTVFQDFRLLPTKTVGQNISFALKVIGRSRAFIKSAVPEALERVGLEGMAKRMPHELSGGEQQRIAIARAIVNRPQIVLADEPTGNLDPTTSVEIMRVLEAINAAGTTVVMATHEAGFVDKMQRRVIELREGRLVRDEQHGRYGDTSAVGTLRPEAEKGASALAARTAALEVQREVADRGVATGAVAAAAEAVAAPAASADEPGPTQRPAEEPVAEEPRVDEPTAAEAEVDEAQAADEASPRSTSIPQVEVDVDELGMAERLGIERRGDDEVGPTS
ncbi:MAG TPA: cell division ATP-binding protein FtsE [Microbacterium sp.]|nr:cell division ATP-binding protein FtsE [Microbacterium sp.]